MSETGAAAIVLRGEHLSNLRAYVLDGVRLPYVQSHGEAFARKHDETLAAIAGGAPRTVRLVAGLDDLCNSGACPRLTAKCMAPALLAKDRGIAALFGLEVGRDYPAPELLEAVSRPMPDFAARKAQVIRSAGL